MRILLIEDDHEVSVFLKARLTEKCFAVDCAESGTRAIYLAKTNDYDLILLDYSLPEKNGFEVCRELREYGNHVPIIMISVTGEISHKVTGFELGIDDYITKPFFFDELYARI